MTGSFLFNLYYPLWWAKVFPSIPLYVLPTLSSFENQKKEQRIKEALLNKMLPKICIKIKLGTFHYSSFPF